MCAVPKTAPCARALFTVGVIAGVGKDVNRLRTEARALRHEIAGLRTDIDARFERAHHWMSMSYWTGRADEREIWEKRQADLANATGPPAAADLDEHDAAVPGCAHGPV